MTRNTTALPRGLTQHHSNGSWRWTPTPERRAQGWVSTTFKNADGTRMTLGQAVDAACAINALIDDLAEGIPIHGRPWAHLAPADAVPDIPLASPRSIGALMDAFLASDKFKTLGAASQRGYKTFLGRLLDGLAKEIDGDPRRQKLPPSAMAQAAKRYDAAVAFARACDISELLTDDLPLQDRYDALRKAINPRTGLPMTHLANAVMTHASGWLTWCCKHKVNGRLVIPFNPALSIERKPSPGRVNPWPAETFERLCTRGRDMGWHSVIDAALMAAELSWSQADILALTYRQFIAGVAYDDDGTAYEVVRVQGRRGKTLVMTHTTLTERGLALFQDIRNRWRTAAGGDNIEPAPDTPLFVVDAAPDRDSHGAVGKAWNADYFRHVFADIKQACEPPITAYTFADLRDTAFTECKTGGLDDHMIQSRSQHASTKSVQQMGAKHYGAVSLETSDAAARQLNTLHARLNKRKGQTGAPATP